VESPINATEKAESAREAASVCQLEEMLTYGSSYLGTKVDSLKSLVKEGLIDLFTEASFVFFGMTTLLIAVSFLMYGIAMVVGGALGGELWLGFVITGGSVVLVKLFYSKLLSLRTREESVENKTNHYDKELMATAAFLETSRNLRQSLSEMVDVKKWTRKHPFYSMGVSAATGFIIAGSLTSLVTVAEDVLKEAVAPLVKEHLASLSNVKKVRENL